jgi:ferrochelatase
MDGISGTSPSRSASPALPGSHPQVKSGRIGVLLVNLGTPDATDYWSMRRYLKEFLSDRRVIEVPRLIWWPVLNLIILTARPAKSGEAYRAIWNHERNESPLRTITRSQAEQLAADFAGTPAMSVDWAMRYGNPSIASRLSELHAQGCDRILIFPLYPQYSAATTATVQDTVFDALKRVRWQPAIRTVPPYYASPAYIAALARSLEKGLAALDFEPEAILASFHGLPKAYHDKGDPYYCHCAKTVRLLSEAAGRELTLTFQSRFGRAEWLQPYTAETIENLAKRGVKRLAVITPGFAADCLETLEELSIRGRELFCEHGGERFAVLPCLNGGADGMDVIKTLARQELQGWL